MGVPKEGVWCPAVTIYDPKTGALDLESQKKWYSYLSKSGLTGLVILGTNAETFLLTREERAALVKTAREAVGPNYPLMVGVSGFSVYQVMEFIDDAKKAGADYGLLLPAAYFGKQTTQAVIESFYNEVAQKSSLPLVIYNFPGVCNGVDLDSETIAVLAKGNLGKIVGVKLTCGSVAKITRLAAELPVNTFATFGGQADFLIGGMAVGSAGCITAFANVFPKTISRIYDLYKEGKVKEALELHRKAALAESPAKAGIAAVKYAASIFNAPNAGIEDAEAKFRPRAPYTTPADPAKEKIRKVMAGMVEIEKSL